MCAGAVVVVELAVGGSAGATGGLACAVPGMLNMVAASAAAPTIASAFLIRRRDADMQHLQVRVIE